MPGARSAFPAYGAPTSFPFVLSPEEVSQFFEHIYHLRDRAALMLCYGAGLRISEAVAVKISDIDSQRRLIRIVQGKGKKDRYVMLSPRLLASAAGLLASGATQRLPVPHLAPGPAHHLRHAGPGLPQRR